MINRICLSSTFKDLEPFRAAVARAVRRINKEVEGMEDYVTSDQRPLDKCRLGVAAADVYVGVFAYRYGYIPDKGNPEGKSITELEYGHARANKKPCLLFLHKDGPWDLKFVDQVTGEGDRGQKIGTLREQLEKEGPSFFKSEEELAGLVIAAIGNLEATKAAAPAAGPAKTTPEKRQIVRDVFVAYRAADETRVRGIFNELLPDPQGVSSLISPRALFARTEEDFLNLDRDVQTCDVAVAMISSDTLSQMDQDPKYVAHALDVLRSRTGALLACCLDSGSVAAAAKWNFDEVIDVSGYPGAGIGLIQSLKQAIATRRTVSSVPVTGVPLVIAAITESEANDLCAHPEIIGAELGLKAQQKFEELKTALGATLAKRYGPTREGWRSPGSERTVTELSLEAIRRLARTKNSRLQGRVIKLQRYSFEALLSGPPELREMYRVMSDAGCVLVVDELSMFHPAVRQALAQSPMVLSPNTAVLTVSPFSAYAQRSQEILREELRGQLRGVFDRFESDYDPQCELNVGDECRVLRWLHQSLPETLKVLRTPRAIPEQLAIFAKELQAEDDTTVAGYLYSRGGGL